MPTIREVKTELRHREWGEQIQECQSSGMTVTAWCKEKGISQHTYYSRLNVVRKELLKRAGLPLQQIVPLSVSQSVTCTTATMKTQCIASSAEPEKAEPAFAQKVIVRKDGIEVEMPPDIEHLEEQILKRNKMLFGQKSEKSKFICNGQMDLDGNVFNEAEELSNLSAAEPTEDSITKKSKKTGKHRGRNELRGDLETKEIVHTLPEDQRKCAVCGSKLMPFSKEYITTRLCIIPAKIFKITYFREVYKCEHCDKHGDKANIVKAPNLTPAPVIPRGLPEAELIAYIAEAKYLLGEPLYRMEQHFKMQGIYLNRTSLANWIIKSSEWLIPVVKHFWKYAYLEPVLNADETTLRVLKIHGKPVKKKGQMWVICTGASAKLLIAIYTYLDNRSKVTAEELLGSYDGIVQTDGLGSYGSGEYLHAGCWSHARRKFVDSIPENDKNSKAAKAVEIIDRAFVLEREARKANVPPEKILEMRQKEVRPIIEEFYNFIGTLRPSKGSHLGAAVTYVLNQKYKLLLFLGSVDTKPNNASFRQNFTHPALKSLDRRQPACDFLPCLRKIYARKSAYYLSVNTP